MKLVDAYDAWGYTIFCDDIRVEIGHKLTYVGAYGGRMLVHSSFPVAIAKLCLGIVYYQRLSKVVMPIKINVFLPGDPDEKPSVQAEMPPEATQQAIDSAEALASRANTEAASGFVTANMQLALTPLNISQPGLIKVRAVRGDELIRLGTLAVEAATEAPQLPIGPIP